MRQSTTITASVDPATRFALANLRAHLTMEGDYSLGAIVGIVAHVAEHGTLDDAPFVYPSEVESLTEVLIRGFPEVDADDPSWGSAPGQESMFRPLDDVVSLTVAIPDAPDWAVTQEPGYREGLAADGISLMPITGGSDDDVPPFYEPSPADWADYHATMDAADQAAPSYLDPDNLIRVRRSLWGV